MRAMKDSGIPWIGEIPEGWKVMPHKRVMRKVKEIQEHYNGENILSLTMRGVIVRDLDAGGKMPTTFDGYQKVYPNNLLQCLFDIDVTPRCVGLIREEGLTSPAYSQFAMYSNGYAPYYDYLLRYMDDGKTLLHLSKNLRSSLTETDFGAIDTCVPPLAEQQRIAEFLDRKCAEVDEMIALQEQIIEELKAYKQSVITEAVTKGLNPTAPMRDSGIEWIGSIPEHWEVKRIKYIGTAENGLTYTPADVCDASDGILVLRSSNIQNGKLAFNDNVYVRSVPESLKVKVGDIIICSRNGSASLVGKSALVETDIDASFGAFMMRFRSNHSYKYIYFLLTATISHYKQLFTTTTINQLTIGLLNNIAMPFVENKEEQQAIADYLDKKCGEIDKLIAIKQSKIDSLKEYKKSIIYEYVTGKKEIA